MRDMNTVTDDAIAGVASAVEEFKTHHTKQLRQLGDRVDQLEAAREGLGGYSSGRDQRAEKKQLEIFRTFLKERGRSRAAPNDWMAECSTEYKAFVIGDDESGGHAVPEVMESDIKRRAAEVNQLRALCRVVPVTTAPSSYKVPISRGNTSSGWAAETTSLSETTTPTLQMPNFPDGVLYAMPKLSNWALDDVPNLREFIATEVGESFGVQEASAFLTGNGTNKPKGILAVTPTATDDDASPERTAFALEYLPLDPGASPAVNIQASELITLAHQLKSEYWPRATWLMSRLTLARVRRLRDSQGRFLWEPSLQVGVPSSLLGLPVAIQDQMASVSAGALSVLVADFRRLYTILERPTRLIIDEVTSKGQTICYFSRRTSGHVVDSHAGKVGKIAAA